MEKKFIHGMKVKNIMLIMMDKKKEKKFLNTLIEEFIMENELIVNYLGKKKLSTKMGNKNWDMELKLIN